MNRFLAFGFILFSIPYVFASDPRISARLEQLPKLSAGAERREVDRLLSRVTSHTDPLDLDDQVLVLATLLEHGKAEIRLRADKVYWQLSADVRDHITVKRRGNDLQTQPNSSTDAKAFGYSYSGNIILFDDWHHVFPTIPDALPLPIAGEGRSPRLRTLISEEINELLRIADKYPWRNEFEERRPNQYPSDNERPQNQSHFRSDFLVDHGMDNGSDKSRIFPYLEQYLKNLPLRHFNNPKDNTTSCTSTFDVTSLQED